MQLLLTGKKRLARFSSSHDKENGIPSEWKITRLSSVVVGSSQRNGDLAITDIRSVNKTTGMQPMEVRYVGSDISKYKIVKPGWFAYNPMRLNIGSIKQWSGEDPCVVSPDYVVYSCDEKQLSGRFMARTIQSDMWSQFMRREGNGSVRVRIYLSDLGRMKILLPTIDEQNGIVDVIEKFERDIDRSQELLENVRTQKKGLMQKLLTGEIRVKVTEDDHAE